MPFPLADPHQTQHAVDGNGVEAGAHDLVARLFLIDMTQQDRVQHVVRRQRVLVFLVLAQLGGGRATDDGGRYDRRAANGVPPARQRKDFSLVEVFDRRVATAHVAIDGGVADRVFAFIAGGQQQPAQFVRQRHQHRAAGARLQIFFGHIDGMVGEHLGQRIEIPLKRLFDRDRHHFHAQRVALFFGEIVGQICGVARRHPYRDDVVRTQRVDRERQHHRRIDAAGQAQPCFLEPVLAAVIADAAHDRAPRQRIATLVAVVDPLHRGEPAGFRVVIHNQPLVGERSRGGVHYAVAIGDHRRAVEYQRVLAADHIEIGDGGAALVHALRHQCIALRMFVALERRSVWHQHQLRTLAHGAGDGFGEPQVFADDEPDRHALDLEHAVFAVRIDVEITAFVEHRIIR